MAVHALTKKIDEHGVDGKVAAKCVLFWRCDSNFGVAGVFCIGLAPQLHKVQTHDGVGRHILARDCDANNCCFQVLGLFRRSFHDANTAAQ